MPTIAELGAKVKAKYPGQYDDLDDAALGAKVKAKYPGSYDDFEDAAPVPQTAPGMALASSLGRMGQNMGQRALGLAPAAGAVLGGFGGGALGGLGGAAGGALAGAGLGEAGRQAISQALGLEAPPSNVQEAIGRVGQQANAAALQGAFEGGGQLLVGGAKGMAKHLMGAAIGPTAGRTTPWRTAMEEGITATRAGFKKVMDRIEQSDAVTKLLLKGAERRGTRFVADDLLTGIPAVTKKLGSRTIAEPSLRTSQELTDAFIAEKGSRALTPLQVKKIVQDSAEKAKALYDPYGKKLPLNAEQIWHKAVADRGRELLRDIHGIKASESRTQSLIELKDALSPTVKKALPVAARLAPAVVGAGAGAAIPGNRLEHATIGGLAGYGVSRGVSSPAAMSNLALFLSQNPQLAMVLSQLPRTLGEAGRQVFRP